MCGEHMRDRSKRIPPGTQVGDLTVVSFAGSARDSKERPSGAHLCRCLKCGSERLIRTSRLTGKEHLGCPVCRSIINTEKRINKQIAKKHSDIRIKNELANEKRRQSALARWKRIPKECRTKLDTRSHEDRVRAASLGGKARMRKYRESIGMDPDTPITPLRKLQRAQEAPMRLLALERDEYTCQLCGQYGRNDIEIHHINPFSVSDLFIGWFDNLIALCKRCHRDIAHDGNTYLPVNRRIAIKLAKITISKHPLPDDITTRLEEILKAS